MDGMTPEKRGREHVESKLWLTAHANPRCAWPDSYSPMAACPPTSPAKATSAAPDLVDCMVALPGRLFYSTQIPVCFWFFAKDKLGKSAIPRRSLGGEQGRSNQTLFIDTRKLDTLINRVHHERTDADLVKINSAPVKFSLN